MSCLRPINILLNRGTDNEYYQYVRCRECEDCKQAMRSAAFIRMKFEYDNCIKNGGFVFFFTLTFMDEFCPFKFHRMCFDKVLVQKWIQKFRQEFRRKYGYRVKYVIVSELGHVGTHRPHHHGIFYLYKDDKYQLKIYKSGKLRNQVPVLALSFAKIIHDLWQYGRCDIQEFDNSKGGFQYVAKYIAKFDEEEKLFKDIITRIQLKRGKGNPVYAAKYYSSTYPALHAFMQRYCPFVMFSQGVGITDKITDSMLENNESIVIDGFRYNIPRYYVDRYVRKEIKACQDFVTHPADLSDCDNYAFYVTRLDVPTYFHIKTPIVDYLQFGVHNELHPIEPLDNARPSQRLLEKFKRSSDLFSENLVYGPMPYYRRYFTYSGRECLRQVLPKQSEVSQLSSIRKKHRFFNILSYINDSYENLPPILKDSCMFDIPKILKDTPSFDPETSVCTDFALTVLHHLDELNRTASEWRARSRIEKMEQKRKEKIAMNSFYAKKPLTWEQYRDKSKYFAIFYHV